MDFVDLEQYIGIDELEMRTHSIKILQNYIEQFMLNIPFEAIDVFNGDSITMDVETNLEKFIKYHRGGLCYENNFVTNRYLKSRGFDTKLISGYVKPPNSDWKEMDTHLSTIVSINEKDYIADTGFGHFPSQPIPLDGQYIYDETDIYRIVPSNQAKDAYYVQTIEQNKIQHNQWTDLLYFENTDRTREYFDKRFDFTVNHPDYAFKKILMVNKKTLSGHNTMSLNHVTITTESGKERIEVTSKNYRDLLQKYFGLDVIIPRLEK
ncbi:arylamine N-acetyltransferase [Staphylococcus cohnii species complex 1658]|uniref:arylamine N-acetyltransferase family protein n=1 Tax=Staphylococcus cohnii species complex 1658 TaxID=3239424 RepID=UPI0034D9773A